MELKKFKFEVKEGALLFGVDSNADGENVISGKLDLGEAVQEAFNRGLPLEGARLVELKFELTKVKLVIDSDKDGEKLLELSIDLGEAFDEISALVKK